VPAGTTRWWPGTSRAARHAEGDRGSAATSDQLAADKLFSSLTNISSSQRVAVLGDRGLPCSRERGGHHSESGAAQGRGSGTLLEACSTLANTSRAGAAHAVCRPEAARHERRANRSADCGGLASAHRSDRSWSRTRRAAFAEAERLHPQVDRRRGTPSGDDRRPGGGAVAPSPSSGSS
jgi:hypothetical protein